MSEDFKVNDIVLYKDKEHTVVKVYADNEIRYKLRDKDGNHVQCRSHHVSPRWEDVFEESQKSAISFESTTTPEYPLTPTLLQIYADRHAENLYVKNPAMQYPRCMQCSAPVINGKVIHKHGCPVHLEEKVIQAAQEGIMQKNVHGWLVTEMVRLLLAEQEGSTPLVPADKVLEAVSEHFPQAGELINKSA